MIKRLRKNLALLLSLVLCLSFSPAAAYAEDDDMITISKRAPVDIVFVMDSTGSMREEIGLVKDKIKSFLNNLYDYNRRISEASDEGIGIDPRIAIVDYKDITGQNEVTTFHKRSDGSYWFVKTKDLDDGEELTYTIDHIDISGGGYDGPETPTEALAKLYKADDGVADIEGFEWRADAQKFVFLITDASFKVPGGIPNMSEVTEELSKRNIHASVVTNEAYAADYHQLYTETDGKLYDIGGDLSFMEDIIENIIKDIIVANVTISAAGAPEGIGCIKLARYIDKDGKEQKGPAIYCGDDSASVNASWGSKAELEISANKARKGVEAPDGKTYVIDKITVNGVSQNLPEIGKYNCRITDLEIDADTAIQVLFTIGEEPEEEEEEPVSYTVRFDSNGGSQVSPQSVKEGEKASMPDDPERDGYTFNHWYLSDESKPYDFSLPVMSDLTLTASWSRIPASYTVRFDSNGGSPVPSQIVKEGEKASVPNRPERAGYAFNYWYLLDESKPFYFGTPITSDITLTASWNLIEKEEEKNESVSDNNDKPSNDEAPEGLPSDWTKLRHVTHENAISSNYCVIARKQRFDVKPYISGATVYKSDNKKIASVSKKSGIVKGKSSGDAVITGYVKSGGQLIPTGSYTIHVVTPELTKKQYLSFNTDGSIDGNEHIVNEVLIPTIWTSSNPSVATVSSNSGKINVLTSKGKVKISAFYGLGRNAARYRFTLRIKPSGGVG